jgi:hypothetical protein
MKTVVAERLGQNPDEADYLRNNPKASELRRLNNYDTSEKLAGSTSSPAYRACEWCEDKSSSDRSEGLQ